LAQIATDTSRTVYSDYFGLKEPSFSITPDPQYLFLSQQHREALAHLLYGAGENGGFVLLTGEVGTGKTTVCRAFLEQLPEHVDVALILNPALTGPELLQSICEEFGVELPREGISLKVLISRLNAYLLEAHGKGRRPVVMIDEAQNLAPEVLEQVRLLTNLETAKHKLLQIFLVGQPELRELLRGERLRQLDQRITARFHLSPLGKKETHEYIRHRLAVAGVERRLFTPGALGRIYQLTGGVPRLINILCDRALLGTYATRSNLVSARIVTQAHRELRGEGGSVSGRSWRRSLGLAALGVLIGAGAGWLGHWGVEHWQLGGALREWVAGQPATTEGAVVAPVATTGDSAPAKSQDPGAVAAEGAAAGQPAKGAESAPLRPDAFMSDRRRVLSELLARWQVAVAPGVSTDLCVLANNAGLRCRGGRGTWKDLRAQNRPAMIRLRDASGKVQYGLVSGLDDTTVTLTLGGMVGRFPLAEVQSLWSGDYLLLWRLPPDRRVLIGASSRPETVRWLRRALVDAGVPVGDLLSGAYDTNLIAAVRQFQSQRGLTTDGIAGSETLIRLDQVVAAPDTPRLSAAPK